MANTAQRMARMCTRPASASSGAAVFAGLGCRQGAARGGRCGYARSRGGDGIRPDKRGVRGRAAGPRRRRHPRSRRGCAQHLMMCTNLLNAVDAPRPCTAREPRLPVLARCVLQRSNPRSPPRGRTGTLHACRHWGLITGACARVTMAAAARLTAGLRERVACMHAPMQPF